MLDIYYVEQDSLLVGRFRGTLDARSARKVVELVEAKETHAAQAAKGFNRFCDLSGLKRVNLSIDDVEDLARRRGVFNPDTHKVKSAFYAAHVLSYTTALLYAQLLSSRRITVEVFSSLEGAARWLKVDPRKLRA